MNKSNWKGFERDIARMFGSERNPLSGSNSKHSASDSLHGAIFIECKKRKQHSLHTLYRAVSALASQEDKTPIIVTKETRKHTTLISLEPSSLPHIAAYYFQNNPDEYHKFKNIIKNLTKKSK